jgi:hypothetical protein
MVGGGGAAASGPAFQAAGLQSSAATGGVIATAWPTHLANDIGLAFFETANQPVATPSGWNAIANGSQGVGTAGSVTGTCLQVFWRRAAGSSESNINIAGASNTGDHIISRIITVRGCIATGDPINVSAGDASSDADTTAMSIPGATTTVPNTLVVAAVSNQIDTGTAMVISSLANAQVSLTQQATQNAAVGNGGGFNVLMGTMVSAGAYGVTTGTLATATRQGRVSFALLPV